MVEHYSKIEIYKDKGKEIIKSTGKVASKVLTLGKVKDNFSEK